MRIAQIAPLYESVPPKYYGGTERAVSYLTEELVRQGHDVTLFASGDSQTNARLVPCSDRSLRLDPDCIDQLAHHIAQLEEVFSSADEFDVMHFHNGYLSYPMASRQPVPHVTTLHGRLDLPDLVPLHRRFPREPLVSISNDQRRPLPWLNWEATIYHGLPLDLYNFHPEPSGYLAFIGRISPEKRLDRAIEIALGAGMPLKVAAKVDPTDREYFETRIEPLMHDPSIEFLQEIGEDEKGDFLGNAAALLFPIDWPEPFGLVMIEAMACGTPVIAFSSGSVPEVLEEGVTGCVVNSVDGAVAAVSRARELDRLRVRRRFEARFSVERMANDYCSVYRRLIMTEQHDLLAIL